MKRRLEAAYHPPTTLEEIYYAIGITGDEAIISGKTEPKMEIAKTIERLPEAVRAVLFDDCDLHFFTGRSFGEASQMFIPAHSEDRTIDIVFLASDVWRMPRQKAMNIIAHELAHIFLGHNSPQCRGV